MVDFDIMVEESFWHEEYVTASTIVIEEIFDRFSQEVSHAGKKSAMQSGMQKSAMKEQNKFNKYEEYTREMDFSLLKAFIMQMTERLIHQYEGYTREVKEVFMMHMEERLIYLYNKNTNLIIFRFVEVDRTIINMKKYNTAAMQEEQTVQEENTRRREDFWSFRDMKTRHGLIWRGKDDS